MAMMDVLNAWQQWAKGLFEILASGQGKRALAGPMIGLVASYELAAPGGPFGQFHGAFGGFGA